MGRTFQSGIISRLVVGGGTYAVLHNETQIDVDNSNGLPTIIKLQPIDPSLGQCTVYINDYGNNSSVGNITIMASGGNLINGQPTLVLDTDGIGAEISVSDQKNFIASLNNDSQTGGGTITGANNGLTVFGTDIQLGGNLIMPTTIDALGSNTFSINDQAGLMFKTRDALGNFFFNNIGGNGTLVGSSQYIFSYLGDGGNVFTDSLIVINFGGANHFTQAVDFWNFGDYTQANLSSSIFNIGRFNHFDNVSSTTVMGYSNDLNAVYSSTVLGSGNTYSGLNQKFILGNNNKNLFVDGVTGYVGINEVNPQGMLHIKATGSGTAGIIVETDSTQDAKILFATNNAVVKRAKIWVDDTTQTFNFYTVNNDTIFYNGNGLAQVKTLSLFTNNTAKFESNVGIAVSPSARLHVQGIDSTTSNYALKIDNSAFSPLLYARNDGNVGIGTANPLTKLHVDGGSSPNTQIYLKSTGVDNGIQIDSGEYPFFKMASSGLTSFVIQGVGQYNILFRPTQNIQWRDYTNNSVAGMVGLDAPNNYSYFYHKLLVGSVSGSPSASLHLGGVDATSSNYALKVDNSASTPLFYIRNDGFSNFNNGDLTIQTISNVSILDVANYKSFKISMTGSYGDFIKLSNTVGDISLYKYTTIGGLANPSGNCTLEIGSNFSVSSLGVKNIAFVSSASGLGMMAIGSQGSASIYGTPMQRFTYDPVSFGGLITDLNNNYHRVGFGIDPVITHRVIIADGLKIATGGINAISLPVGNVGLVSGDLYVDTSANILANGDLVVGRKV